MPVSSFRVLSSIRTSVLCSNKIDKVLEYVVRNASKFAETPGIAGLGGKIGKITATTVNVKISVHPVETNVERLQTHLCGSNLQKEGGEDVQLKPDSEYPDWLWKLNLGPKPHYSELTPDDKQYWLQLMRIEEKQKEKIKARLRFR